MFKRIQGSVCDIRTALLQEPRSRILLSGMLQVRLAMGSVVLAKDSDYNDVIASGT
jgi:hypothetical protein